MTLSDQILSLKREENDGTFLREDAVAAAEANDALDDAAQLAQEADALMKEMAEALEDQKNCDPTDKRDVLWCHKGIVAALDSYNQHKEQSND